MRHLSFLQMGQKTTFYRMKAGHACLWNGFIGTGIFYCPRFFIRAVQVVRLYASYIICSLAYTCAILIVAALIASRQVSNCHSCFLLFPLDRDLPGSWIHWDNSSPGRAVSILGDCAPTWRQSNILHTQLQVQWDVGVANHSLSS